MKKNKILIILLIALTLLTAVWTLQDESVEEEIVEEKKIVKEEKKEEKAKIKIDIKGEISAPGVYELTTENNVIDAINMAGGLTEQSDTSNINLSKKLTDEMVIIIYSKDEIKSMNEKEKITCPPCNNACINESDERGKLKTEEVSEIININKASKEELLTLKGIGESKADAIIEYREKEGEFKTIEDIKNVPGIGEALFEKIKENITV
ncbi:MAG: helix-hairpin-helix domain-containing protein [Bacilli bacterium]|nr:helix-hairpin-helix domain-containing protein [Bacilli bacterium]